MAKSEDVVDEAVEIRAVHELASSIGYPLEVMVGVWLLADVIRYRRARLGYSVG